MADLLGRRATARATSPALLGLDSQISIGRSAQRGMERDGSCRNRSNSLTGPPRSCALRFRVERPVIAKQRSILFGVSRKNSRSNSTDSGANPKDGYVRLTQAFVKIPKEGANPDDREKAATLQGRARNVPSLSKTCIYFRFDML